MNLPTLVMTLAALVAQSGSLGTVPSIEAPSSTVVHLHLMLGTGSGADVVVRDGGAVTISTPEHSKTGLVLRLAGAMLHVALVEYVRDASGAEREVSLGSMEVREGVETVPPASPVPFAFVWTGTGPGPTSALKPAGPCTRCCVTCQGFTVCGCHIVMDCGSCCCPDTCNCDDTVWTADR